ncbi:MAG: hypothetical protein ABSG54_11345 [Terriglobia bacterium]
MSDDIHKRAESLLTASRVEGISPSERGWLKAHLQDCARCAEHAATLERAVAMLRSIPVPLDRALVEATRFRVRLRAHELREERVRMLGLWISCGLSWALGVLSAPLVWQELEWVGERTAIPRPAWMMAFVIWWVLPAVVIAAVLIWRREPAAPRSRHPATLAR